MAIKKRMLEKAFFNFSKNSKKVLSVLSPSINLNPAGWESEKQYLRKIWLGLLGEKPCIDGYGSLVSESSIYHYPDCSLKILFFKTGQTTQQKAFLLQPKNSSVRKRPLAIIPYYNPEPMAGVNPETGLSAGDSEKQLGRHLVRRGYTVICGQAFPYTMDVKIKNRTVSEIWTDAAEKLFEEYPAWTGMGRLFSDTKMLLDYGCKLETVDCNRVVAIGHSLGGKMAFYTGCLDSRVSAIIASDFGFAFSMSNWNSPWYLGEKVSSVEKEINHQHLLVLHAPKPFLLVAGKFDNEDSKQYMNSSAEVYRLYNAENSLAIINHASGHNPPFEVMQMAYDWLETELPK